ncbi:NAD(P)-binding domain-containing protein [Streptomyces europaeiscabiei]|uniref:pyrroline-5-carboxylate reductase family protein n=1 Tax=Streptomyces europaeiscabiei TaxID=146819 RepID=UPI002E178A89
MKRPVAFVGCGRITRAMVGGLVAAGHQPALLRGVSRTGAGALALRKEFGVSMAGTTAEAVDGASVIVLAVHPHETEEALAGLSGLVTAGQVVVSVVASCRSEVVAAALPGVPVIRAVPNVAVAVRDGVTVLAAGPGGRPDGLDLGRQLFELLGQVLVVDEAQLEVVSAVSGAGPALVARFTQSLAEAAVGQGLPPETAQVLAAQAVRGTGALLCAAGMTAEAVVESVSSPHGMTEAALLTLEEHRLDTAVEAGVQAAVALSLGRMLTASRN